MLLYFNRTTGKTIVFENRIENLLETLDAKVIDWIDGLSPKEGIAFYTSVLEYRHPKAKAEQMNELAEPTTYEIKFTAVNDAD